MLIAPVADARCCAIALAHASDASYFRRNRRPLAETFAEIAAEVLPAFHSSALEYTA